jgi:hypothetical protein
LGGQTPLDSLCDGPDSIVRVRGRLHETEKVKNGRDSFVATRSLELDRSGDSCYSPRSPRSSVTGSGLVISPVEYEGDSSSSGVALIAPVMVGGRSLSLGRGRPGPLSPPLDVRPRLAQLGVPGSKAGDPVFDDGGATGVEVADLPALTHPAAAAECDVHAKYAQLAARHRGEGSGRGRPQARADVAPLLPSVLVRRFPVPRFVCTPRLVAVGEVIESVRASHPANRSSGRGPDGAGEEVVEPRVPGA